MAKFCEYCGSPLSPGVRFCAHCGRPLVADSAPTPTSAPTRAAAYAPPKKNGARVALIVVAVILILALLAVAVHFVRRTLRQKAMEATYSIVSDHLPEEVSDQLEQALGQLAEEPEPADESSKPAAEPAESAPTESAPAENTPTESAPAQSGAYADEYARLYGNAQSEQEMPPAQEAPAQPGGEQITLPGGSTAPAADFIFPYSGTTALSSADLDAAFGSMGAQDAWMCSQRALNEIYARHGYNFHPEKSETALDAYNYFSALDWYNAIKSASTAANTGEVPVSQVESDNIQTIVQWQTAHGLR